MTIQENIKALQFAYEQVRAHPLCGRIEDDGLYIRVIYPAGYWPDGVQCSYGLRASKTEALERILKVMEKHWQENLVK